MKTVLVLPAYNAEKTLKGVLTTLPKGIFYKMILVDDCSKDGTYKLATQLARTQKSLSVFKTPRNLGYGGNMKMCFRKALALGADVIVELHPDGEYLPDAIIPALGEIQKGAQLVLGNRFTKKTNPLKSGMFFWKYPVLRALTAIDNFVLGTNIPDLHQGFRVYTKALLKSCHYKSYADNFLFTFQIISDTVLLGEKIASVPVKTKYEGKKRGAIFRHSLRYTLGTFSILVYYLVQKSKMASTLKTAL